MFNWKKTLRRLWGRSRRSCREAGRTGGKNFNPELIKIAAAKEHFFLGGEFIFDKMNFLEKIIVKKASKITSNKSNILEDNICKFAQTMNAI